MSENIKRISVDEGAALFERAGMEPLPAMYLHFIGNKFCGCLVGAQVAVAFGCAEKAEKAHWNRQFGWRRKMQELGYTIMYTAGLIAGFDAPKMRAGQKPNDKEWQLGFADGAAIRQRVLPVATEGQSS